MGHIAVDVMQGPDLEEEVGQTSRKEEEEEECRPLVEFVVFLRKVHTRPSSVCGRSHWS